MRRFLLVLLGTLVLASAACAAAAITTGEPKPVPGLRFFDLEGRETSVDAFRGEVVVLNLWATWCAPCREEMPSLSRLQARFADAPVRVVALSVDRAPAERVKEFMDTVGVSNLSVYRDPTVKAARLLKVLGLPATLLLDREGREVGRVLGIAEWDGAAAVAAVDRLLQAPPTGPDMVKTGG
jgi:thiol-disulfide isomerase/thioredoxin